MFYKAEACRLIQAVHCPQVRRLSSLDHHRRYVPRRDLMYVPGSDLRKVEKIPKLGADCICIDCEDGVAINMKQQVQVLNQQTFANFLLWCGIIDTMYNCESIFHYAGGWGLCYARSLARLAGCYTHSAFFIFKELEKRVFFKFGGLGFYWWQIIRTLRQFINLLNAWLLPFRIRQT